MGLPAAEKDAEVLGTSGPHVWGAGTPARLRRPGSRTDRRPFSQTVFAPVPRGPQLLANTNTRCTSVAAVTHTTRDPPLPRVLGKGCPRPPCPPPTRGKVPLSRGLWPALVSRRGLRPPSGPPQGREEQPAPTTLRCSGNPASYRPPLAAHQAAHAGESQPFVTGGRSPNSRALCSRGTA